jgi:spore germination protein YaaH
MTYAPIPAEWVPRIALSALEQSKRHGSLRDPETGSPYYAYRAADGHWRQGWFEDETSIADKLAFIQRERLAGIAAFPLGYDAGRFDPMLANAFGKRPDCRVGDNADGPGKQPARRTSPD